jgi:hypothetical protein
MNLAECLATMESVVIHGANSVCGAPRPSAFPLLVTACVAVAFALLLLSSARRVRAAMLVVAAAAALPGLFGVTTRRADAGSAAFAVARHLRELGALIESQAQQQGCVRIARECLVCDPIARYALPHMKRCAP